MKDFGRWLHDFSLPVPPPAAATPASKDCAPEDDSVRVIHITCCVCGKRDLLASWDIDGPLEPGFQYFCGSSPICCP